MTLIEVMVAAAVLMIGLFAVAGLVDSANKSTVITRDRQNATNLTREFIEAARGLPYASISQATVLTAIAGADPQLTDSQPGNPYTIVRNGISYTVTTDVCIVDDARDGGGSHTGGTFCGDSAAPTTPHPLSGGTDRVPEDYKRVRVSLSWAPRVGPDPIRTITQTTLVNNPGSAGAPAVATLTATSPALGNPPVQVTSATAIDFALTTTTTPASVRWLIDGTARGSATGSGKSWGFTWNLGAIGATGSHGDGPYLVSAEAFDQYGVSGAARSMTVTLNRSVPIAPGGFVGGKNGSTTELEWLPNPERDLAGYRVFRLDAGVEVQVCGLSFVTTCIDSSGSSSGGQTYRVRSYDKDPAGALRVGGTSELTTATSNGPPGNPVSPTVVFSSGLSTATLSWTKPNPEDPNTGTGDYIAFYRIYRGGTGTTNRYTKVSATGTSHTFQDIINGTEHRYWVSAVDTRYGESQLVEFVKVAG